MGKHSVPAKDQSTNPLNHPGYKPKHGAAGSDLPARDVGVKSTVIKKDGK